ncbi:MAG: hypothetical protein ABI624_21390 [Casimicrobiaceae bacterium]
MRIIAFITAAVAIRKILGQLGEPTDAVELTSLIASTRSRLFRLGLAIAPLALIPVVNLFASLFSGIAFTYMRLDQIEKQRAFDNAASGPRLP